MPPTLCLSGDIGGTNGRFVLSSGNEILFEWKDVMILSSRVGKYSHITDLVNAFLLAAWERMEIHEGDKVSFTKYPSSSPSSSYIDMLSPMIQSVRIALCGPTFDKGRKCSPSNLFSPDGKLWRVSQSSDLESLGIEERKVLFLNDFVAIGHAVSFLRQQRGAQATWMGCKVETLYEGEKEEDGVVAVIGAGTGLGACYLTPNPGSSSSSSSYSVWASEAGMAATFCPRTETEWKLMKFISAGGRLAGVSDGGGQVDDANDDGDDSATTGFVEVERYVAGPTIPLIFRFFCETEQVKKKQNKKSEFSSEQVEEALQLLAVLSSSSPDVQPALVVEAAFRVNPAPLVIAKKSVHLFLDFLGRQLCCTALTWLCYGGMFLAGGVAPRLLIFPENLEEQEGLKLSKEDVAANRKILIDNFLEAGVMNETVRPVPLGLVWGANAGSLGAMHCAESAL